jgi:hypothetical protein
LLASLLVSAEFSGDQDDGLGDIANDDVDPEGPIKEHLLSEVHKRRGQKRKERTFGNNDDSAHILDQYDALTGKEQHQEGELEDDGPALAAFNMDEAEQEEAGLGGGERKGEEEEDAWLQSLEDQVALLLLPLVHMQTYPRM